MRNNIAIRNILTAVCGVLLFISTALAIVFSAESVFTRAQTDGWSVSLSLRNDLVLKVQTDAAETLTAYVSDGADGRLNEAVLTREENGFFEYHGVTPQLMTNDVVFETEDGERKTISVRTYCQSLLAGDTLESQSAAQRAALQTLAADVLNYGAAAQSQQNYRTEDLANNVLTDAQKDVEKRYASLPAPENVARSEGTSSAEGEGVRGAGVRFDNAAGLYFTVVAPQGIEGLALQITKSGTVETLTAFEETGEAGIYKVSYPAVYVAEYDEPLTAQLVKAGEPVGNILTYSMDSYIANKASDAGMGALVKSMYVFAASAREYAAADPTAGIVWGENTMFGFTSTEIYTVASDADNKKLTVSYTAAEANSWKNIVAPIGAEGAENNHVGLTLASKTDKPISVRVNLLGDSGNLVKEAYVSEGTVSIDDGAMCLVPANGSIDVVIYYEGAPNNIELMIDSTAEHQSPANTLEISGMKFGFKEKAAPSPDEDQGMLIVGETIKFTTTDDYKITTNTAENSMTVAYENISGGGYKNITGTTDIGDNNTFTFTVQNNGAAVAKIRVDIVCPVENGSLQQDGTTRNDFCNLSMTATGVIAQGNEYLYGGADWFTVAAGETASITVTFDEKAGATAVRFFIDSSTYDDEETHTGEVVFSDMALSNVLIVDKTITFITDGSYTITTNAAENSMTAAYENISGNGYKNITGVTDIGDNNTFTFNVRNNGTAVAKIRVDIVCPLQPDGTGNNFCNLSMTATGVIAQGNEYLYGGGDWFTVAAGETASIRVTFDETAGATAVRFYIDSSTHDDETTHTGEVVFSDMALDNVVGGDYSGAGDKLADLSEGLSPLFFSLGTMVERRDV